jgi:hypothetical protein
MSGKLRAPGRPHTHTRTGWADAPRVGEVPDVLDPAALQFSVRTDVRRIRPAPSRMPWAWVALAAIALAGFALVVNAMLERSGDTAGRSEAARNVAPAADSGAVHDEPRPNTNESDSDGFTAHSIAPAGRLIYKCVSSNGATAYQSVACEDTQTFRKAIIAVPDDPRVVASGRRQQARTANAARTLSRMAGTDHVAYASPYIGMDELDRRRAECNAAKSTRESTLRAVGLARTYDLLQKLDEQVREACKGV